MTKKRVAHFIFLFILLLAGILLRKYTKWHYVAGIITGASCVMLFIVWVGYLVVKKTAAVLDKRVRDIIVEK